MEIVDPYCEDCKHIEKCKKEYGDIREDEAVFKKQIPGSHFCRKSWDNYKCIKCCTEDMKD